MLWLCSCALSSAGSSLRSATLTRLPNEPAAGNVKSKRCATKGERAAKQKLRDAATREQAVRNAEEKVHRQTAEAQADAAACDVCLDAPKTHLLQPCGHYTASATTACAEAVFADHELALSCVPRSVPQRAQRVFEIQGGSYREVVRT